MEWNTTTRDHLSHLFLNTLSPTSTNRRLAESALNDASQNPNFGLVLLRLISEPPSSIDDQIRQSAAVYFKNHLRTRWSPNDDVSSTHPPISAFEKQQIKSLIVPCMLNSTLKIQSQLSEALSVIGKYDFPKEWPTLLPELVAGLRQANDYSAVNGILGTANSIFKKFRYEYKTNELLLDLKYCLDNFAAPLLEIFLKNAAVFDSKVVSAGVSVGELKVLLESQRLCCRLFYSLNFQDFPEFFEDHMMEWMTEFKKYLTGSYPMIEQDEKGLEALDDLRAAVCDNIILYMEKNEEEFQSFLNDFALAVWNLLVKVSSSSLASRSSISRDKLTITAIKFLTTVSTSVHHSLFAGEGVIPMICQSIVIPNVRLRDEDEELFEMNHVEFMRRDMEGSDQDTRRRIACELLKGVAAHYKEQVSQAVSLHLQNLLSSFAANPSANWKDKECALFLVVSLATKKAGGTLASTDLVDVQSFLASIVLPELRALDVNEFPILKASALKFLTVFRNQIPKPAAVSVLPDVIRFLGSETIAVQSYAANLIEKLLLVKDEGVIARYTSADINPFVGPLMGNLFNVLRSEEPEENTCVMKCIMRVLGIADISHDVAGACIQELTSALSKVCANPNNPIFNHYLFESVALLVRRACKQNPSLVPAFEEKLFPIIQKILAADGVLEFFPYAFQLLAQLVQLNSPPLSQSYMQIYDIILTPDLWKNSAYAPALARLLRAFLQKVPHELNQQGKLSQVLETFKGLVSTPKSDDQGFYLLNTLTEYLRFNDLTPHTAFIWSVLFLRLQNNRTVKFVKSLVVFMSLFVVKHGTTNLVNSMNVVQENIFMVILQQFWIPNLKLIAGFIEVKVASVAAIKLLCESPSLLQPDAAQQWGKLLDSVVTLISRPVEERLEEEPEVPDLGEAIGNPAAFIHLHNAGNAEEDPVIGIRDPKEFMVNSLSKLSALSPGRFPQVIGENLEPVNQEALLQLCHKYNKFIV